MVRDTSSLDFRRSVGDMSASNLAVGIRHFIRQICGSVEWSVEIFRQKSLVFA